MPATPRIMIQVPQDLLDALERDRAQSPYPVSRNAQVITLLRWALAQRTKGQQP